MATEKLKVRSVSRRTLNAVRRDKRRIPNLLKSFQSEQHKVFIISRKDPTLADLQERYKFELNSYDTASKLFDQYSVAGATWAACMQAAKTNWVSQFHLKWGEKLRSLKGA